ncbi:11164_t:CDS:2 [Diversispora eburnea]|uniref:11164_t:CDS:1 n=1 Tax=Diversispora eburnea TaxID=1213867 RepID=A0A9N8VZP1_9GLOM|nr:11164_t:CDS:2 [Diversispora eburnea]
MSQPPQQQSRRMAHILSEQKRRENINSGFEELKSIVPSCRGCADSKAVILRKAAHYIQTLENQIQKLKQSNNNCGGPTISTPPNLSSPAMSVKSISSGNYLIHIYMS